MILQILMYVLVVAGAAAVVFTRDPKRAVFVFSFYGITLGLLFLIMQAPDVALSEVAVGAAAVPLVTLVTLSRMRGK